MIISCPSCNAGFFVSPSQIGATGRRVKCSKCKNIWHATVPAEIAQKKEIVAQRVVEQNFSGKIHLPAIIDTKINKFLYLIPSALLFLILSTIWLFYPGITSKLGLCGSMCIPDRVMLEDINYYYDRETGHLSIDYAIANRSSEKQKIPMVELKLKDNKGTIIAKARADGRGNYINSDASIRAHTEFENVSNQANYVQLTLGNPIKFWFR